jgi:hypothetical protein
LNNNNNNNNMREAPKIIKIMKSSVFWDITPCSPLNVHQRFGETFRLLQG